MQDIHRAGGQLFGGVVGERRFSPHCGGGETHQALKCPRCDSLNTKFCYYNNYNLSQPRHFCKSCRRYWTNGGVIRNVPVGGRCRRNKRPKPSKRTSSEPKSESSQSSGGESSAITGRTSPAFDPSPSPAPAPGDGAGSRMSDSLPPGMDLIPSEIGSFAASSDALPPLGFQVPACRWQPQNEWRVVEDRDINNGHWLHHQQLQGLTVGLVDPASRGLQNGVSNGGLAAVDWQGSGDDDGQGPFDLTGTVDPSYWVQLPWSDQDHHLHHFP